MEEDLIGILIALYYIIGTINSYRHYDIEEIRGHLCKIGIKPIEVVIYVNGLKPVSIDGKVFVG